MQEPNKLRAKVTLPKSVIEAPFQAKRAVNLLLTSKVETDSGIFIYTVADATLDLSVAIDAAEDGVLKAGQFTCQARLGPSQANLRNNHEAFMVDLSPVVSKTFKLMFESAACGELTTSLMNNLNQLRTAFKPESMLGKDLALKGKITLAATNDYLQLGFFEAPITGYVNRQPSAKCETAVAGTPQAVLTVSDALLNGCIYQAHKS